MKNESTTVRARSFRKTIFANMYQVILYYKFAAIEDLKTFWQEHRRHCLFLNLKGRVYIAKEGINGTVAGLTDDIASYKKYLCSFPGFEDTEFKDDTIDTMPFVKLIVKQRPEIVSLKTSIPIDPTREKGRHLSSEEWKATLDTGGDYQILDVRNNYESAIGHFEGAILPDVENFYNFPQWLDQAPLDKNKKVLMYCTGGIRCEKFSLLMEKKGFKNVYQLHGGIINYAKEVGDAHYRGKCFVFDDRLAVSIEENQKEPLSRCAITGTPCDQYLNCANSDCNNLFVCSEEGAKVFEGCCSEECLSAQRRRPFDPDNIYTPTRKKYFYQQTREVTTKKGLK